MALRLRVLNVFALPGDPFSGNPLGVFEGGDELSTEQMQALARQLNLSETTFVLPAEVEGTDARVRIFTPTIELPFAGHPTLGTAAVVAGESGREVVLGLGAGPIPVTYAAGRWTLTANRGAVTECEASADEVAGMLSLTGPDLTGPAQWVDSGLRQLVVQVATPEAVWSAAPDAPLLRRIAMTASGEALCYVWAWSGPDTVEARLFFSQDTAVVEDPATGSAAANLGSLLAHLGRRGVEVVISQGAAVARPSRLHVEVTDEGSVRVGGVVRPFADATVPWP